ncbi:MAG TPA: CotH kinase family protein [Candidatus Paceibacterota bacterium]
MKKDLSKRPLYVLGAIFLVGAILATSLVIVAMRDYSLRLRLLHNPAIQYFKHSYNSFRKLSDIVFLPYLFAESNLPVYDLNVSVNNTMSMNEALSPDPISGRMTDDNAPYVKALFEDKSIGFVDTIDLRYRGQEANHWNSLQKSYRIRFDDKNLWGGKRLVNFIIPYDRFYYIEPMNMYRAKKFGLIDVPMKFVRLNLNGTDNGVYLMFEQWSPEFLEKKGLPQGKIFSLADGVYHATKLSDYVNTFDEKGDVKKEELAELFFLRDKSDVSTFKRKLPQIMDMDKLYHWNILNILARSNHQNEADNLLLYWNDVTLKFEMIPWDIEIYPPENPYTDSVSLLMKRVLSIPEFRARRDELLRQYIENPKNLEDDLAFYDKLEKETKIDFLKDNSKLQTDFTYLSNIKKYRRFVALDFEKAKEILSLPKDYYGDGH